MPPVPVSAAQAPGPTPASQPAASYPSAELDRRFTAFAVDRAIGWGIATGVGYAVWKLAAPDDAIVGVLTGVGVAVLIGLVTAILLGVTGLSVGKAVVGLRVVRSSTGRPIGVMPAIGRSLVLGVAGVPTAGLGLATLAWTAAMDPERRRRGLHDRIGDAIVVDVRPMAPQEVIADERPQQIVNLTAMRLMPVTPVELDPPTPSPRQPPAPAPRREEATDPRRRTAAPQPHPQAHPHPQAQPAPLASPSASPQAPPPAAAPPRPSLPQVVPPAVLPQPSPQSKAQPKPQPKPQPPPTAPADAPPPRSAPPASPPTSAPAPAAPTPAPTPAPAPAAPPAAHRAAPEPRQVRPPTVPVSAAPNAPRWHVEFDTGESFVVEGLALVGRRPEPRAGEPVRHVVPLRSADMSLSKTHAQFQVAPDGALVVMDRGSTNGSSVQRKGHSKPLTPGRPSTLLDGDVVRFGDRQMRVRRAGPAGPPPAQPTRA